MLDHPCEASSVKKRMKSTIPQKLKSRLAKDRPMTTITLRIPQDVVDSLKAIAPHKGYSGYQALLKAYISEGLRKDEAVHLYGPAARLAEALKKRGVDPKLIEEVARELAA
jgi:hypothetical protein